jgi:phosphatidylinositol 4-kinase
LDEAFQSRSRGDENVDELDERLEFHAQFLFIYFNSPLPDIRRIADMCLTKLIEKFPFLLWNGRLITAQLKIIQALSKNIDQDLQCRQTFLPVAGMSLQIPLMVSKIRMKRFV